MTFDILTGLKFVDSWIGLYYWEPSLILFSDATEMFATFRFYVLMLLAWFFSRRVGWPKVCQAATTPRDSYLRRKRLFKNIDCAVYISMDYGTAMLTNVEATMHTASLIPFIIYTAVMVRVVLLFFYNADTYDSGLEINVNRWTIVRTIVNLSLNIKISILWLLRSQHRIPMPWRETGFYDANGKISLTHCHAHAYVVFRADF